MLGTVLRLGRPFLLAIACSWMALFIVAFAYSQQHGAGWIWTAALPAFLFETLFYVASITENTRERFGQVVRSPLRRAAVLWASALIPYALLAAGTHTLELRALLFLAALCAVFAFWYAVLPHRLAYDAAFLVVAAAPVLTRVFPRLYVSPSPHLRLDILGHLMWIRLGLVGMLVLRGWNPGPVSFWPKLKEWRIGLLWFAAALLPMVLVASAIKDLRFVVPVWSWRVAVNALGTFFGGLWVIALSEELFFRGFVERALLNRRWDRPLLAVAASALLYGAGHLWFRHFPDYRRAATAIVLGIFCGLAYWRSRSIRASMVTHACAIVTMRVFFR